MAKILFAALSLTGGGAERVVSVLSSALAEKGYEVGVLLFQTSKAEYALSDRVKRFQMDAETYVSKGKRLRFIRKVLKQTRPDYLIPFVFEPMLYCYIANLGLPTKYIATVRNYPKLYPSESWRRAVAAWISTHCHKCMLQTQEQAACFRWKSEDSWFVVPNPVDSRFPQAEYTCRETAKRLTAAGRLNEQKDYPTMIAAFAMAADKFPEAVLDIYGAGEERERLEQDIQDRHLENRVFLRGRTENVLEALKQADGYILSSKYEGMPNSLMEAMAVGLPCVSTVCPTGPRDLIEDGESGLLVPVGNAQALAAAMEKLLSDADLRKRLGENARKTIQERYTLDSVVAAFEEGLRLDEV